MKLTRACLALLLSTCALPAAAALPRFPQPTATGIVFVADGNIWQVARQGGQAVRLTSAPGQDLFPRASPDGRWIAYTEASQAGTDVWVIPAAGGTARRLTYHPTTEAGTGGRHAPDNMVVTWMPDSSAVLFLTKRRQWNTWIAELWQVPVAGGAPTPLPIDIQVGLATYGPDGHSIAYNRIIQNFRTWKRYNGGLAQQVYTYDFTTKALAQITTWSGTNTSPMWAGRKIYYLSDQDANRRANIWAYDLDTKQTREITHFADYDIDFPALGEGGIAFQQAGKLWMLDLPSEQVREVPVSIPDDNARTRIRVADVKDMIRDADIAGQTDFALAPNGKRTLFSARGDVFSVPTEDGPTRDLTSTPGADEDHPAWSPDGKLVAYTTDASGGQQIAVRPAEGGPERLVTHFGKGYPYGPVFSPDGRALAFSDSDHKLWVVATGGGAPREIAHDVNSEIHDQSFSPDGRWLAFSMAAVGRRRDLYLAELASGRVTRLGDGTAIDGNPVWSPDGKYLYFTSNRHENMVGSDVEFDFAELKSTGIYAIPLAASTPSPVAPRSDEADTGPARDKPAEADKDDGAKDKPDTKDHRKPRHTNDDPPPDRTAAVPPIRIDPAGMMARAVLLPVPGAEIAQIDARGQRIYYLIQPIGTLHGPIAGSEKPELHYYDLKDRDGGLVAQDVDAYSLSLDGQHVLIKHDKDYTVVDAKDGAGKAPGTKKLELAHLRMLVDPRAEWAEMFENGWRLERDFFFSPVMNGTDWQHVHDSYAKLLPLAGSREDLNYILGGVLGEIGNSHTYVGDGDDGDTGPEVKPALLGVDWALDQGSGRYRIATIYPGDNTRDAYRSPLGQPGLAVKAGDYVLAINGAELRAPTDPDALLQLSDPKQTVDLTIAATPAGPAHHIVVTPVEKEIGLRETAWIARNRATVDRLSGGRIGYVYMSDMGELGLQQFMRQFYAQQGKQALIMDDRWNGGGFIAPFALDRLRHALSAMDVNRQGGVTPEPNEIVLGPKVALLNHWSASDGDIFPYLFKQYGLGKLIGTRSWGGVRGIRGEMRMMDGGYVTVPEQSMYGLDSTWLLENRGVDPDIEVENQPVDLLAGRDAQLERGVAELMAQLAGRSVGFPPPPALIPAYPASGIVPPRP